MLFIILAHIQQALQTPDAFCKGLLLLLKVSNKTLSEVSLSSENPHMWNKFSEDLWAFKKTNKLKTLLFSLAYR